VKTAMPVQTLDVSRRLPGPDRVVKAITFGLSRTTLDADGEHHNGGIPGRLQGFFFVIRTTGIRVARNSTYAAYKNMYDSKTRI
jgi:hypothetical protein